MPWAALLGTFVLYALLLALPAHGLELEGRVVAVIDGDTIQVLTATKTLHRVRLAGIDAPERSQAYGQQAKRQLADFVFGHDISIDWHKKDRFGRVVGRVLRDGIDINLLMVETGFCWHYVAYANEQSPEDRTRYAIAEAMARKQRKGLWREGDAIAPWDFRRTRSATTGRAG